MVSGVQTSYKDNPGSHILLGQCPSSQLMNNIGPLLLITLFFLNFILVEVTLDFLKGISLVFPYCPFSALGPHLDPHITLRHHVFLAFSRP